MTLRVPFAMTNAKLPLVGAGGEITKEWFNLLYNIYNGVTQGLPQTQEAITLGASPFTYQAVIKGRILVSAGTVSNIEYSRNGIDYFSTGQTSGFVSMDYRDYVRITYSAPPALVFFPS